MRRSSVRNACEPVSGGGMQSDMAYRPAMGFLAHSMVHLFSFWRAAASGASLWWCSGDQIMAQEQTGEKSGERSGVDSYRRNGVGARGAWAQNLWRT